MSGQRLPVPADLANVPQRSLKDFLVQYSRVLCDQFAPAVSDAQLRAFVNDVFDEGGQAAPADVVLEFKHVCRFSGCHLHDCQLCRNNPSKVCESTAVFDRQYWVRDDGKGGQVIKARCGADVSVALTDRATGQAVLLPGVVLKLFVVNGQANPAATDPAGGLYLGDDGHPLFSAAGCVPDDDGGVTLELAQDDLLGTVARLPPEFQFLGKNSKFKAGGRTFKSFKLCVRALGPAGANGVPAVLAQVDSDTFKVTTKKGYDGCRKAEYLFAHQPITDKTFASLGETTISNLKNTFEGVDTVEDLMRLVQASATSPELQARLRDTLNMARDTDKWKKLTAMLSEKVVWDDSIMRLFVVPTAALALGLVFRAIKGQVDFDTPVGLVFQAPTPTGQVRAVKANDRSLAGCGRHVNALKQLAASCWGLNRHPGWTLVPEQPKWEHATLPGVSDVFSEVLGPGDPMSAAETYWMQLAVTLQQSSGPTGSAGLHSQPSPLRSPTPLSSDNHAAAVAAVMAAADTNSLLMGASLASASGPGGLVQGGSSAAAAAAGGGTWMGPQAATAAAVSGTEMGLGAYGPGGTLGVSTGLVGNPGLLSPFEGGAMAAAGASGSGGYAAAGGFSGQLGTSQGLGCQTAGSSGFNRSSGVLAQQGGAQGFHEASPFALPATSMLVSGRTTSNMTEGTSDTGSHSTPANNARMQQPMQQYMLQQQLQPMQQQAQQQYMHQQQQQMRQPSGQQHMLPHAAQSLGVHGAGPLPGQPLRTVSEPAYNAVPGSNLGGGAPFSGIAGSSAALDRAVTAGQASSLLTGVAGDPSAVQGLGLAGSSQGLNNSGMSSATRAMGGPFVAMQQPQLAAGQQPGMVSMAPQQLQQQQLQQPVLSPNTMLLQQAIVEGWPAPQMKALLDQMSDEELQQLVELHAASEAAAAAAAAGGPVPVVPGVPGAAASAAAVGQQPGRATVNPANLQGFGSTIGLPSSTSGIVAGLLSGAAGAHTVGLPVQQQQQQAPLPSLPRQQQLLQQQQKQQQQQAAGVMSAAAAAGDSGAPGGNPAAAAGLAALFADAGVGAGDGLQPLSDVQLTGDQGMINMDSFTGDQQWGDLLNDLRAYSSGSGNRPALAGVNSFSTDWIPELLCKKEVSARLNPAAAASAGGQAGAVAAGQQQQQQQQGIGLADILEDGAAVDGQGGNRKGKRERSKTGQAPTAEQRQEWQAMFGVDSDNPELRSLSKADQHYDSFNRHFPVARVTSKTAEVQQGGQVANPFQPGQRLSGTGVSHPMSPGSPNPFIEQQQLGGTPLMLGTSPPNRATVTTDSPMVPERSRTVSGTLPEVNSLPGSCGIPAAAAAGGAGQYGAPAVVVPPAQTEEGAAALESVTGFPSGLQLEAGVEGSMPSGNGLRGILDLMCSDAAAAAADGTGINPMLSSHRTDSDAAAVAAAAAAETPFTVASREPMHPPAPQQQRDAALLHKDSFGKAGWITGLFRRSSSSSKSGSGVVGSGGSGSGPSGGSHSSKDPAGVGLLVPSGSVRGPAAGSSGALGQQ